MEMPALLANIVPLAASDSGGSGNFLVTPGVGLMLWTLLAFGLTLFVLYKLAFPRIAEALDRRQRAIEESIDTAARLRTEAEELLEQYRERLKDARTQAEEILVRARKAAEVREAEAINEARQRRDELLEQTRRDIETETRRAIQEIRNEVADLTILATEKVTRKVLTEDDQRKLVDEALGELDFSQISGEGSRN
jgi:F-type H+-transporting ATPase subunit b